MFLNRFRKLPPAVRDPLKRLYWRFMYRGVRILPPTVRDSLTRLYRSVAFQDDVAAEFTLDQAANWLSALRECGIEFAFPEDLNAVDNNAAPLAILKHDIHHNLDRAVAMAEAEHEKGIAGLYFMMGPHYLNKEFFGSNHSWEQLRTIQKLGHRIGLHLDIVDAILRRGDLYEEIADVVTLFSSEGLAIKYGNSHGNSGLKAFAVRAGDFFVETAGDIRPPQAGRFAGSQIAEHLRRYSLKHIGERFGLRYWVDNRVRRDGVIVSPTLYVTDNTGAVRIPARKISSKKFQIDEEFIAASTSALVDASSLILLHPQWYAPTQKPPAAPISAGVSFQGDSSAQREDTEPVAPNEHFNPRIFDDLEAVELTDDRDILDLSILNDGLRYDCRLNRRRAADHLIVALHGGVAGAKLLPVLARWTQHTYFRAPILSFFDPLIYEHPGIPAGWFVGDLMRDATAHIASIVREIAAHMNIPVKRVVFIGSSSGGFAAARLACAVGGAKFVSINGQMRIVDYYSTGYEPFSSAFDSEHSPHENAVLHESRWSTVPGLEQALQNGTPVRGIVIQNVNDKHHFQKHYTPFCARFGLPPEGGSSADGRLRSVPYEGEAKHAAEPPDIARRIIKEFIPQLLA